MHPKTRVSLCTQKNRISLALKTINALLSPSKMLTKQLSPPLLAQWTVIFFCLSFISAAPVWSWSGDPTVNTAISTAASGQVDPQITSDGAGGAIITWEDYRTGRNYDIYAQRINSTGNVQWTADGVAISSDGNYQTSPQITSDGAGGAIITWRDTRNSTDDIYAQRVNSAGAPMWTPDGVAISTTAREQYSPQITSDGAGGAIITWSDMRDWNNDIYAQRVNADGVVLWTADGVPITTAIYAQIEPQITSDRVGGAIITWSDDRNDGDYDIYAQRVNGAGNTLWAPDGVPICTAVHWQNYLQITSDGAEGAIITWRDHRNGYGYDNDDIYAQRINSAGAALWTADGVPICTAANEQTAPQITSNGAGGAIITWRDKRNDKDWNVYAQSINGTGAALWTADGVAISTAVNNWQFSSPQISSDGAGGAIITWRDYRNNIFDIYAQRVNGTGAAQWTANGVAISTAVNSNTPLQATSDGAGGAIITWDISDIYAQRVYCNGTLNGSGALNNAFPWPMFLPAITNERK
jgi:hypothetical protein